MPLAFICWPRRRSIVSSSPQMSSPVGANTAISKRSKRREAAKADHRGAVQDAMIVLKAFLVCQPTHAQAGGDGAFADSEDGPNQKQFGVMPYGFGKQG